MSGLKEILSEAILFDNKLDRSSGEIIENQPLQISWQKTYNDLKSLTDKIDPFEFGVHYDLGVRTFANTIRELWIVRGTLNENDKIDNYRATIGWNEQGHEKLLKYKRNLTAVLGQPFEENNNFEDYKEAANSWGPFNLWKFGDVELILWGSDFRGSMWYKIDIKKK